MVQKPIGRVEPIVQVCEHLGVFARYKFVQKFTAVFDEFGAELFKLRRRHADVDHGAAELVRNVVFKRFGLVADAVGARWLGCFRALQVHSF